MDATIFTKALHEPATAVAVFAALVALLSGILGPFVQLVIGWRQSNAMHSAAEAAISTASNAGNRAIATMRLEWLQRVRDTLSEFHSILMTSGDPISDEDQRKLSHLGTKIDLLLNLDESIQYDLWAIADKIYNTEDYDSRAEMDPLLMKAGRVVMKAEWEKIKTELRGGS